MSGLFEGLPEEEESAGHCFAASAVTRNGDSHAPEAIAHALATPGVSFHLLHGDRVLLRPGPVGHGASFTLAEAVALGADPEAAVVLGTTPEGPRLAALVPDPGARGDLIAVDLRSLAIDGLLPATELGTIAQARSLTAWNARHARCARCGEAMTGSAGGYRRGCAACGLQEFPRTDPVVIMAVVDDDRALLGRQPHFPPGRFSCLAGFMEPGEAIETAVRREVLEEAGIAVGRVRYHSSQPWPFPYSLMIGCHAEARSTAIDRDPAELEDCRWFTRDDVAAMLADNHPNGLSVPPVIGIANRLLRVWVERG